MSKTSGKNSQENRSLPKAPTSIQGLDEITGGGFPRGRPTLICGSAGAGKTLLAMEFLIRGHSYASAKVASAAAQNRGRSSRYGTGLGRFAITSGHGGEMKLGGGDVQMTNEMPELGRSMQFMDEAEQTLRAIQYGTVDAFVIEEPEGHRVYTLEGSDLPYSALVERMQRGAAMLDARGCIL